MLSYLKGIIYEIGEDFVVIDINGIGYKILCSKNTIVNLNIGKTTKLFTTLVIRDDSIKLYGFFDKNEMNIFKQLNLVSGVGPKVAFSLLSSLKTEEIIIAIATKNYKELTKAPGIGKKTAERIILELKDKLKANDIEAGIRFNEENDNAIQTINALMSLGYNYSEASMALSKIENKNQPINDLIKEALKQFSRI